MRVLVMSSWVGAGGVGLSVIAPALARLGVELLQLPTVVLSNHRGWPRVAGGATPPEQLAEMLDAYAENGWLDGLDAALFGYLPSRAHVACATATAARVRAAAPAARIVVDPVLGDDPKGLYLPAEAAAALGAELAPEADCLTPNRFELAQLTARPVESLADAVAAAHALAAARPGRRVLVTSPPISAAETGLLDVSAAGVRLYRTRRRADAPNGVGDLFAGLIAAGDAPAIALARLDAILERSLGRPALRLGGDWTGAAPWPSRALGADGEEL